jgi:putative FmdB family regulatory protein
MPLYEYQCTKCGARFEKIRKFSDPPLDVCPKCGGGPVEKLLSAPAFQFKGSGFYITDYARKGESESGAHGKSDKHDKSDKHEKTGKSDASAPAEKAESQSEKSESSSSDSGKSDSPKPSPASSDSSSGSKKD